MNSELDFVTLLRTASKTKRANKCATRLKDGTVKKYYESDRGFYWAETIAVRDIPTFGDLECDLSTKPDFVLSLGIFKDAPPPGEVFHVWPQNAIADRLKVPHDSEKRFGWHEFDGNRVIARLARNMVHSNYLLLERDTPKGTPDAIAGLSDLEWLDAMDMLWPGLATCGRVVVPSSSKRILDHGRALESNGLHLYVKTDASELSRVWRQLLVKGFGTTLPGGQPLSFLRPKFSRTDPGEVVAHQESAIYDPGTIGAERLVFDGVPSITGGNIKLKDQAFVGSKDGLEVADAVIVTEPGPDLDPANFADVTAEQAKPAARSGVRLGRTRSGGAGGVTVFKINVSTVTLDLELQDIFGNVKTIRQSWLDCDGKRGVQSPFRESTSLAAYYNVHKDGVPFVHDSGTHTKYLLTRDSLLELTVDDFIEALRAWLATQTAPLDGDLINAAYRRVTSITAAAIRHEWGPQELAALAPRIAEMLRQPFGQPMGKLTKAIEAHMRATLKVARPLPDEDDIGDADGTHSDLRGHTDEGLALNLGKEWDGSAKHVAMWGRWLFWEGSYWCRDETLAHMTKIRGHLRGLSDAVDDDGLKHMLESRETVNNVAILARSNAELVATVDQWDADPMLLATPGGTVDLRTGELRPPAPGDFLTKATTIEPAPVGTPAPTWEKFLHRVTDGDHELIAYLQRAAGYWLTGSTVEHALFFLWGTGRNGKTTFVEALMRLMGPHAVTIGTESLMTTIGDRHPTETARLHGVRLAVGSEVEEGQTWAESKLKKMTGGDRLQGRFMRQDFFEFDPQFKLVIFGNHKPSIRNVDEAIKARLHLVPFTVVIPPKERDTRLGEKLTVEGPAILRWALDGCRCWQEIGLDPPACARAATKDYLFDEHILGQWLIECVRHIDGANTPQSYLFENWRQYASVRNLNVGTSQSFGQALADRGHPRKKTNIGQVFEHLAVHSIRDSFHVAS
jgi:putative DNA primase/helicase